MCFDPRQSNSEGAAGSEERERANAKRGRSRKRRRRPGRLYTCVLQARDPRKKRAKQREAADEAPTDGPKLETRLGEVKRTRGAGQAAALNGNGDEKDRGGCGLERGGASGRGASLPRLLERQRMRQRSGADDGQREEEEEQGRRQARGGAA